MSVTVCARHERDFVVFLHENDDGRLYRLGISVMRGEMPWQPFIDRMIDELYDREPAAVAAIAERIQTWSLP